MQPKPHYNAFLPANAIFQPAVNAGHQSGPSMFEQLPRFHTAAYLYKGSCFVTAGRFANRCASDIKIEGVAGTAGKSARINRAVIQINPCMVPSPPIMPIQPKKCRCCQQMHSVQWGYDFTKISDNCNYYGWVFSAIVFSSFFPRSAYPKKDWLWVKHGFDTAKTWPSGLSKTGGGWFASNHGLCWKSVIYN